MYNTRNVTPQDLCRLKEILQRKRDLPEFRSYVGAEVLKILRYFLQLVYDNLCTALKLQHRECDTTGPVHF